LVNGRETQLREKMMQLQKLEMFSCGVHFGHKPRYWNPQTEPYVYGKHPELDLHIIDLDKSLILFDKALQFVRSTVQARGNVLFVGTKRNAQEVVKAYAELVGMPYVTSRWLGGMLTNFKTIKKSVEALTLMEEQFQAGRFEGYTKKERLTFVRRLEKLRINLGGIKAMKSLPDVIFVIDVKHEAIAIAEANKLGIPVIGIVDTNASPAGIDYVVPGNDDSVSAINYYAKNVAKVIGMEQEKLAEVIKREAADRAAKAPKIIKIEAKPAEPVEEIEAELLEKVEKTMKKTVKRVTKAVSKDDEVVPVKKTVRKKKIETKE
jgi:small subunit ribosomal protein S2